MAVTALFTVLAIMHIGFLMAAVTVVRRFKVLLVRLVAGIAAGLGVLALETEIRLAMVECRRIQQYDVCIPPLMVGMAVFAVGSCRNGQAAVKSFLVANVIEYVFMIMALHAELALLFLVGGVVTPGAFFLVFFMAFNDRARHQERLERVRITRGRHVHKCSERNKSYQY